MHEIADWLKGSGSSSTCSALMTMTLIFLFCAI